MLSGHPSRLEWRNRSPLSLRPSISGGALRAARRSAINQRLESWLLSPGLRESEQCIYVCLCVSVYVYANCNLEARNFTEPLIVQRVPRWSRRNKFSHLRAGGSAEQRAAHAAQKKKLWSGMQPRHGKNSHHGLHPFVVTVEFHFNNTKFVCLSSLILSQIWFLLLQSTSVTANFKISEWQALLHAKVIIIVTCGLVFSMS